MKTGRVSGGIVSSAVLPRRLADMLRPELSSLAVEIIDEIRTLIPEYRRPLESAYGKSIRAGVEHAMTLFVDQIADPTVSKTQAHDVHRRLGQNEMREGRSLDSLQAAYRAGTRVAWQRIMRVGKKSGLSSAVMSQLADSLLAFMDELASVALDGYLEAKAHSTEAIETWRRRLLQLILERPSVPTEAIVELAQLTGWPMPEQATPIATTPLPNVGQSHRCPELDDEILADLDGIEPHLLIPGELTDARLATVRAALPDCRLSVGPCVPLDSASDSLRWARRALAAVEDGLIANGGQVTWAERHLCTLLLHSEDSLVARLREQLLAPLHGLTDKQQERLIETLHAWLETQGTVTAMAERLKVHTQTVRYRMRQLEATFGDRLADPDARFEMQLILRAGSAARSATTRPPNGHGWEHHRVPSALTPPREERHHDEWLSRRILGPSSSVIIIDHRDTRR
ncbi:MAG: PucR family transcriptional regulator [Pseudonocardiaceae bacterium]|nr:PucR family transcriptional regulator [Pseudonocardiaceae bacterium]